MDFSSTIQDILKDKGHDVLSVEPHRTVYDALKLMAERGVGAIPVMQDGRLVGMFSERDYARKVILQERNSRSTPVKDIMSINLTTVTSHDSVSACLAIMTDKRIRHLPVMDGDRMIGLVSIGDLVKQEIGDQKKLIELLQNYISATPM